MRKLTIFVAYKIRVIMKIVMDEKIPYLRDALSAMGYEVVCLPGVSISRSDVMDADALFVRTRTRCDAALLEGTAVRFIGTATIGYDHIDAEYCYANGIEWTNAAGCNADAVLQYVQSVLYSWSRDKGVGLNGLVLGIVGVGEIGSRVAGWARSAGMGVLLNDPPRAARGEKGFVTLAEIAVSCDIITFHPTLSKSGDSPSYHLADDSFFASLTRCRLLVNASRGPVVDNVALKNALAAGLVGDAVLDVWENEPDINVDLLGMSYIATPHIAGYSAEGKMNASRMMLDAFVRFSGDTGIVPLLFLPSPGNKGGVAANERDAMLSIYSPHADSVALKSDPGAFERLRNEYLLRREPQAYNIEIS